VQDKVFNSGIRKRQKYSRECSAAEITNSEFFIQDLISNIHHHRYLLPLPVSDIWESTPKVSHPKSSSSLTVIFVGAFNEVKGFTEVSKIVLANPSINFILVSKYESDEVGLDLKCAQNISVYRAQSSEKLISLVDSSDLMLIGSKFESQCLAAIEAATRGVPVCMKDTGLLATLPKIS
jgi:hypothetical protein